jgi:hypothetical protein
MEKLTEADLKEYIALQERMKADEIKKKQLDKQITEYLNGGKEKCQLGTFRNVKGSWKMLRVDSSNSRYSEDLLSQYLTKEQLLTCIKKTPYSFYKVAFLAGVE